VPWGTFVLLQLSAAELEPLIVKRPDSQRLPLTELLMDRHHELKGVPAGKGDVASWDSSIPVVVRALLDSGLGEVVVQVEVGLPHTNSRSIWSCAAGIRGRERTRTSRSS
jgi:hypothetical protein